MYEIENEAAYQRAIDACIRKGNHKKFHSSADADELLEFLRKKSKSFDFADSLLDTYYKRGKLTDSQIDSVYKMMAKEKEMQKKFAEEAKNANPVPLTDERLSITGTVMSVKEGRYFDDVVWKITVKVKEEGYKLYGTLPDAINEASKGDIVTFSAKVKPSDKDPKVGFYSRPTKAKIIEKVA